jgi:hypothetical protein
VVVVTSRFISMKTCNLLISVLLSHLLPHIISVIWHAYVGMPTSARACVFTPSFPSTFQLNTLMQLTCSLLLFVDLSSLNGSSSTSETFNNPCLSLSQEFEVKHVEVNGLWCSFS